MALNTSFPATATTELCSNFLFQEELEILSTVQDSFMDLINDLFMATSAFLGFHKSRCLHSPGFDFLSVFTFLHDSEFTTS